MRGKAIAVFVGRGPLGSTSGLPPHPNPLPRRGEGTKPPTRRPGDMAPLLELDRLTRTFGAFTALHDVTLTLPPGRVGLLGPNGAGKSTLLKILMGLIPPSSGRGRVLDQELGGDRDTAGNWRLRRQESPLLAYVLLGAVILQGLFGKWTVTLKLMPAVVTGHLLGGMTLLALLTWSACRYGEVARAPAGDRVRRAARLTLALLFVQIALGGWTSTNYAALACPDFPLCHGAAIPSAMSFAEGFRIDRALGLTATGEFLPASALIAIHWMHRVGALVVMLAASFLAALLWRRTRRGLAGCVAVALGLQLAIGAGNVVMALPLPLAVLHNAGAALLVLVLVVVNFKVVADRRTT